MTGEGLADALAYLGTLLWLSLNMSSALDTVTENAPTAGTILRSNPTTRPCPNRRRTPVGCQLGVPWVWGLG